MKDRLDRQRRLGRMSHPLSTDRVIPTNDAPLIFVGSVQQVGRYLIFVRRNFWKSHSLIALGSAGQ